MISNCEWGVSRSIASLETSGNHAPANTIFKRANVGLHENFSLEESILLWVKRDNKFRFLTGWNFFFERRRIRAISESEWTEGSSAEGERGFETSAGSPYFCHDHR